MPNSASLKKLVLWRTWVSVVEAVSSLIWLFIPSQLDSADVWLTVPAAWDARGCQMMRDAAITAGLVRSSRAGDNSWKDRLRVITYVFKPNTIADTDLTVHFLGSPRRPLFTALISPICTNSRRAKPLWSPMEEVRPFTASRLGY